MNRQVHYRGVPITIQPDGYRVGNNRYNTIGEAKVAIARNANSKQIAS